MGRQNMMEGGEYEEYPRIIYLRPKMPKPRLIPVYKNATDADTEMVDRGSDQQAAVSTNPIWSSILLKQIKSIKQNKI